MWRHVLLTSSIDTRIKGTRLEYIFQDLINNSAHFPLACMLIKLLVAPTHGGTDVVDFVIMALGVGTQSWFLGSREYMGRPLPLVGNLIGPTLITSLNLMVYGLEFFRMSPYCQLYWVYSLAIGVMQELRWRVSPRTAKHVLILLENIFRTSIPLVLFLLLRALSEHVLDRTTAWEDFVTQPYNLYIVIVVPLFGALIGMANINAFRYLSILRETATELRKYSEWFLGPDLLKRTVTDPGILNLQRQNRTVLFMDIRGFTKWSGVKTPEQVVSLINDYFHAAEEALARFKAIKVELTGDEVLAVFYTPEEAVRAALTVLEAVRKVLAKEDLGVGVGVNSGPMIEGLMGGRHLKKFAVLGDSVNLGKRICDVAAPGEILLSDSTVSALNGWVRTGEMREVLLKGVPDKVKLYPLDMNLSVAS